MRYQQVVYFDSDLLIFGDRELQVKWRILRD
jgi:hypothetical protein